MEEKNIVGYDVLKTDGDPRQEVIVEKDIPSSAPAITEGFVKAAETQVALRKRLLMVALGALQPHDFQDFDGKPYLEGEGAARIMAVIRGFKVGEARFNVELMTPHYFVECQLPVEYMGATTVAIGDCSTADVFFCGREGKSGQYGKHLARVGSEQVAARLILGDAKKKARENAMSRAVTELLGLKGLSWENLEAVGFARTNAGSSVKFRKGSQGGAVKTCDVESLCKLPTGSISSLNCILKDAKERSVAKKDGSTATVTDYTVHDEANNEKSVRISVWGAANEGLKPGAVIHFDGVKVGEYAGRPSYSAQSISCVTDNQPEGGINE